MRAMLVEMTYASAAPEESGVKVESLNVIFV